MLKKETGIKQYDHERGERKMKITTMLQKIENKSSSDGDPISKFH